MTDDTPRHYRTQNGFDPNVISQIEDIALSCRGRVNIVRTGAFAREHGLANAVTGQDETRKPLDILITDAFERICANSPNPKRFV
jgi:hypothetical protein